MNEWSLFETVPIDEDIINNFNKYDRTYRFLTGINSAESFFIPSITVVTHAAPNPLVKMATAISGYFNQKDIKNAPERLKAALYARVVNNLREKINPIVVASQENMSVEQKISSLFLLRQQFSQYRVHFEHNSIIQRGIDEAIDTIDYYRGYYEKGQEFSQEDLEILDKTFLADLFDSNENTLISQDEKEQNLNLLKQYPNQEDNTSISEHEHAFLSVLANKYKTRIEQVKFEEFIEEFTTTFKHLNDVGAMLNSRSLQMIGQLGHQSLKIFSAAHQLSILHKIPNQVGISGLLSGLNPMLAILSGGLAIFGLFRRKRSSNSNNQLSQALQALSQQILQLHQAMELYFGQVYKNQALIYKTVVRSAELLQEQIHKDISELRITLFESIEKLDQEIDYLRQTIRYQMLELKKDKILEICHPIEEYLTGIIEINDTVTINQFLSNLSGLIKIQSSSIVLNGSVANDLLSPELMVLHADKVDQILSHAIMGSDINDLFYNMSLPSLIGFVATYLKQIINKPELNAIDTRLLINPIIWIKLTETYLILRENAVNKNSNYDENGRGLELIYAMGKKFLEFVDVLDKHYDDYLNRLNQKYQESFNNLSTKIIQYCEKFLSQLHLVRWSSYYDDSTELQYDKIALDRVKQYVGNEDYDSSIGILERHKFTLKEAKNKKLIYLKNKLGTLAGLFKYDDDEKLLTMLAQHDKPLNTLAQHMPSTTQTDALHIYHAQHGTIPWDRPNGYAITLDFDFIFDQLKLPKELLAAELLGLIEFDIRYSIIKLPNGYSHGYAYIKQRDFNSEIQLHIKVKTIDNKEYDLFQSPFKFNVKLPSDDFTNEIALLTHIDSAAWTLHNQPNETGISLYYSLMQFKITLEVLLLYNCISPIEHPEFSSKLLESEFYRTLPKYINSRLEQLKQTLIPKIQSEQSLKHFLSEADSIHKLIYLFNHLLGAPQTINLNVDTLASFIIPQLQLNELPISDNNNNNNSNNQNIQASPKQRVCELKLLVKNMLIQLDEFYFMFNTVPKLNLAQSNQVQSATSILEVRRSLFSQFPTTKKFKAETANSFTLFNTSITLTKKLQSLGLIYQEVPGQGHCLYHAVALYCGEQQDTLRRWVAMYIENHKSEFSEVLPNYLAQNQTIETFIEDVRKGKEWAGNLEIVVLMKVLNRPIIIINPDLTVTNRQDAEQFPGEPIFVYYDKDKIHYDCLLLADTMSAREVLKGLLFSQPENQSLQLN